MKKQVQKSGIVESNEHMQKSLLAVFFQDQLKDIQWAEQHLVKILPKLKKAATSSELASFFEDHLEETKQHIVRLGKIFEMLGQKSEAKKCYGMAGLSKEINAIVSRIRSGTATRDVALIFAAQKIEHYEIAAYGSLHQLALTLELNDIAMLLDSTLNEEKEADNTLTTIAKTRVNYDAIEET